MRQAAEGGFCPQVSVSTHEEIDALVPREQWADMNANDHRLLEEFGVPLPHQG